MNSTISLTRKVGLCLLLLLGCLLLLAAGARAAYAQINAYQLSWWTVDGGGGPASGTGYLLNGTIGQPDANTHSSGNYILDGGFWGDGMPAATPTATPSVTLTVAPTVTPTVTPTATSPVAPTAYKIYAPLVIR